MEKGNGSISRAEEDAEQSNRKKHPEMLPAATHRSALPPLAARTRPCFRKSRPSQSESTADSKLEVHECDSTFEQHVTTQDSAHKRSNELPKMSNSPVQKTYDGQKAFMLGGRAITTTQLGRGSFGRLILAINAETGESEAAKIIPMSKFVSQTQVEEVLKEYHIGTMLTHAHIAKMKKIMFTPNHFILFAELAGNDNLSSVIKASNSGLPLDQAWTLQSHLLSAIEYCHNLKIAHLDIKPENLVVGSSRDTFSVLKLIDFGCAIWNQVTISRIVGTMPFIAPEVLIYKRSCPFVADMWSCGVVMLEMLSGNGALNRIMGWETILLPEKKYGKHLVHAFTSCASVHDFVERPISTAVSNVLTGLLCPTVNLRITSKFAMEYFGDGAATLIP